MENKFINLERSILILVLFSLIFNFFYSDNHLIKMVQLIEKSQLEIDSVSQSITDVKQNLIDLNQSNSQTQKQLKDLNSQCDSLARIFSDKTNLDKLVLNKYEKLLAASVTERDSLSRLIKKFE